MEEKMKRFLVIILTLSMLLSLFACNKNDGKKDNGSGDEEPATANVEAWATHLTDKHIANKKEEHPDTTEYHVYMTRGETEGCKLVVYSDVKIQKAALVYDAKAHEASNLTALSYIMNKTHTIKRNQDWTDAAIPYYGRKFLLEARRVVPFIVEFTTTKDTPAGEYVYTYEFKDTAEDKVYATFKVTVHVWDIVLPEEKTFATSVGLNFYHVERYDKGDGMYKKYYDMLLEHNVCAHTLPYDILSPEAEEYMSDPRVTSFVIGLWDAKTWSDEKITLYYNRLKENPEWFKKALFYVLDEPTTKEALQQYKEICERFERLCPGIGVISPFYTNKQLNPTVKVDQVDAMAPTTILWCPKLCLWDESQSYDPFLNYTPEKTFDERMKEMQAEGDVVWSYVCNDPVTPYAQLFVDTDGIMHRLMMWQHYQRDIEGFLYWQTTSWGYRQGDIDPWKTVNNGVKDGDGKVIYGEGFIMYPGTPVGVGGPVASIRLKILRDGIDDIEFLYLAEKVLGKDWVMEKVNEATPTLTSYTTEENFYKLRKEMGDALEAALNAAE